MNELFPQIVEDYYRRTLEVTGYTNLGEASYIAGGACRDYLLGKPISDIDIFVMNANFKGSKEICLMWLKTLYPEHEVTDQTPEYEGLGFYSYVINTEIPINVIFTEQSSIAQVVSEFTCDLSKVYLVRSNNQPHTFYVSGEFRRDYENNHITFSEGVNPSYFSKMVTKYHERVIFVRKKIA